MIEPRICTGPLSDGDAQLLGIVGKSSLQPGFGTGDVENRVGYLVYELGLHGPIEGGYLFENSSLQNPSVPNTSLLAVIFASEYSATNGDNPLDSFMTASQSDPDVSTTIAAQISTCILGQPYLACCVLIENDFGWTGNILIGVIDSKTVAVTFPSDIEAATSRC